MAKAMYRPAGNVDKELVVLGVKLRVRKDAHDYSAKWCHRRGGGRGWKAQSKRGSQYHN